MPDVCCNTSACSAHDEGPSILFHEGSYIFKRLPSDVIRVHGVFHITATGNVVAVGLSS